MQPSFGDCEAAEECLRTRRAMAWGHAAAHADPVRNVRLAQTRVARWASGPDEPADESASCIPAGRAYALTRECTPCDETRKHEDFRHIPRKSNTGLHR